MPLRSTSGDPLTADTVFTLLANARRRQLLTRLYRAESKDLESVARSIATVERDDPDETVSQDDVRRVYISLYQNHVPKLEENGVIEYDRDDGRVSLVRSSATQQLLRAAEIVAYDWKKYYVAALLCSVGLCAGAVVTGGSETVWRVVVALIGSGSGALVLGQLRADRYV